MEGKATGFTNAAIESAIIHSRSILEFLGLQAEGKVSHKVAELKKDRRADDSGVEQFPELQMLTKAKALDAYPGERKEAEAALALIFYAANKGLAHMTKTFEHYSGDANLLEIAFRGVPILLINGFYAPLGIQPPDFELPSRHRVT